MLKKWYWTIFLFLYPCISSDEVTVFPFSITNKKKDTNGVTEVFCSPKEKDIDYVFHTGQLFRIQIESEKYYIKNISCYSVQKQGESRALWNKIQYTETDRKTAVSDINTLDGTLQGISCKIEISKTHSYSSSRNTTFTIPTCDVKCTDTWFEVSNPKRLYLWNNIYYYTYYAGENFTMTCKSSLEVQGTTVYEIENNDNNHYFKINSNKWSQYLQISHNNAQFTCHIKDSYTSKVLRNVTVAVKNLLKSKKGLYIVGLDPKKLRIYENSYHYEFEEGEQINVTCKGERKKAFVEMTSGYYRKIEPNTYSMTLSNEDAKDFIIDCKLINNSTAEHKVEDELSLTLSNDCSMDAKDKSPYALVIPQAINKSISPNVTNHRFTVTPGQQSELTVICDFRSLRKNGRDDQKSTYITSKRDCFKKKMVLYPQNDGDKISCKAEKQSLKFVAIIHLIHTSSPTTTNEITTKPSVTTSLSTITSTSKSGRDEHSKIKDKDLFIEGLDSKKLKKNKNLYHYEFKTGENINVKCKGEGKKTYVVMTVGHAKLKSNTYSKKLFSEDNNLIIKCTLINNSTGKDTKEDELSLTLSNDCSMDANDDNPNLTVIPQPINESISPNVTNHRFTVTPGQQSELSVICDFRNINIDVFVSRYLTHTDKNGNDVDSRINISSYKSDCFKNKFVLSPENDGDNITCVAEETHTVDQRLQRVGIIHLIYESPLTTTKETTMNDKPVTIGSSTKTSASSNGRDGNDPYKLFFVVVPILIIMLIAVIYGVISVIKRRRKRFTTKDTSDINYNNLSNSISPTPAQVKVETQYSQPPDHVNTEEPNYAAIGNGTLKIEDIHYAQPYASKKLDTLYAQPVPKSKRTMTYNASNTQDLKNNENKKPKGKNQNITYANTAEPYAEIAPKSQRKCQTVDNNNGANSNTISEPYAEVLPKSRRNCQTLVNQIDKNDKKDIGNNYENTGRTVDELNSLYSDYSQDEALNKDDSLKYAYVTENSLRDVNNKRTYINNNPGYANNIKNQNYAEPAYCEVERYVNK